jgi:hypothetical protein
MDRKGRRDSVRIASRQGRSVRSGEAQLDGGEEHQGWVQDLEHGEHSVRSWGIRVREFGSGLTTAKVALATKLAGLLARLWQAQRHVRLARGTKPAPAQRSVGAVVLPGGGCG